MNTDLEAQLVQSMQRTVDGIELDSDILDRATRRHRRRITTARIGYGLAVCGFAGVLAAGLTFGTAAGPPDTGDLPTADAQSPALQMANAAKAIDNISYRFRTSGGGDNVVCEGAFDPKAVSGYVECGGNEFPGADELMDELLINGTRYTASPPEDGNLEMIGSYAQYPGKYDQLQRFGTGRAVTHPETSDAQAMLKLLKDLDATVTRNPDGSLHFEYTKQFSDGLSSMTTSGDVTFDASNRIAKVTHSSTWRSTAKGRLDTGTFGGVVELFDYGVPVNVERPARVVPSQN